MAQSSTWVFQWTLLDFCLPGSQDHYLWVFESLGLESVTEDYCSFWCPSQGSFSVTHDLPLMLKESVEDVVYRGQNVWEICIGLSLVTPQDHIGECMGSGRWPTEEVLESGEAKLPTSRPRESL